MSKVVGGDGVQAQFSFGLGLSNVGGIYFKGASGLVIRLPLHITLGPIDLNHLSLGAEFKGDGLNLTAVTGLAARLGPLAAAIEDVGVRAMFAFPPARDGNLGPVDLAFGFKPPNGVGLSLDAGVVKGGGYLFIDPDRGEYAGALELALARRRDDQGDRHHHHQDARRLQGLLAADHHLRRVRQRDPARLRLHAARRRRPARPEPHDEPRRRWPTAVRTGAIETVMFPRDIIANAPKIISDLRAFFPPQQGTFLIGPMVKIGWGTPTLVSLSLGIIIEIPGNIAIVGVLKIALPADDVALIVLQVELRRRDRVRQEAHVVLRRAVRVARRCS